MNREITTLFLHFGYSTRNRRNLSEVVTLPKKGTKVPLEEWYTLSEKVVKVVIPFCMKLSVIEENECR